MTPGLSYWCGISAAVFVAIGLAMAAVRWFHMCRPYDGNPRYYYPGRPFVAGVLLSSLALLPYVAAPELPDAWFLARLYFFPVTLYHFTILLYAYFGSIMNWKLWRVPMTIIGLPVVVSLAATVVLALVPGDQITVISVWVMYVLGTMITGVCIGAMVLVLQWAKRFDEDDFSNPADFPVVFARKWMLLIMVNTALCWAGVLANSPAFLAVLMLLFAISLVLFIITALHPHRNGPVEEELEEAPSPAHETVRKPSTAKVLSAIETVVVKQEAFLDPHLTIQDVADRSGYSRSYIASLFKSEFGGFFTYVNRLRLAHVEEYQRTHPASQLQEALEASGFNSRQTYYTVKSRLEERS